MLQVGDDHVLHMQPCASSELHQYLQQGNGHGNCPGSKCFTLPKDRLVSLHLHGVIAGMASDVVGVPLRPPFWVHNLLRVVVPGKVCGI